MQQKELTDAEFLALFRGPHSKEKGFVALVHQYKEKIYWHIRRMVVVHEDADDVLQNVFIKVWRHIHKFRGDSKLYTWLYRIATNETLTLLEANNKKRVATIDNDYNMAEKIKADEYFDASKLEWKLQLALQKLPEQQRLVFNLRYFDEMPYAEMSKVLNVTEGSLKASYHHAAKKIEQWLLKD